MSEELSPAAEILMGVSQPEGESQPDQPELETATLQDDPQPDESPAQQEADVELPPAAEMLANDPKQFYSLEIPGMEGVTFGDAKDLAQKNTDLDMEKARQELELRDRENGVLAKARETQDMYELLPDELKTPEVTQRFEQIKLQQVQRENQLTLTAIPEWSDPLKATADREGMAELMQGYGFTGGEIGNLFDHRQLKLVRDYMTLKQMVSGIPDKEVKKPTKQARTRRGSGSKPKKIEGATDLGNILLQGLKA